MLSQLTSGHTLSGPAIIIDQLRYVCYKSCDMSCDCIRSTIWVEPNCDARMTQHGDIVISVGVKGPKVTNQIGVELDMIQLSIFSHRFMSIAEQMGR